MKRCKVCGSYAFNLYKENIDQGDLCDVHYWKEKALMSLQDGAQPEPTPEWMTEEEQTAYTFGWFKALEKNNGTRSR